MTGGNRCRPSPSSLPAPSLGASRSQKPGQSPGWELPASPSPQPLDHLMPSMRPWPETRWKLWPIRHQQLAELARERGASLPELGGGWLVRAQWGPPTGSAHSPDAWEEEAGSWGPIACLYPRPLSHASLPAPPMAPSAGLLFSALRPGQTLCLPTAFPAPGPYSPPASHSPFHQPPRPLLPGHICFSLPSLHAPHPPSLPSPILAASAFSSPPAQSPPH